MSAREPTRISLGPLIVALGAILLLVSLFLDWWEPSLGAWTAFEVWDMVLAALALAALAAAARALGLLASGPAIPLWLPGAAALVLIASQLINNPPAADGAGEETGAWLALGASVVMTLGLLLSRVRFALVTEPAREQNGRPVPPAREPKGDTEVAPDDGSSSTRKLPDTSQTSPDSPA